MPPIKRKTWDHAAMIQAVNAVRRKEIGYLRAAKQFGVPKGTLERYVKRMSAQKILSSIYEATKAYYSQEIETWLRNNSGRTLTNKYVARLFGAAYEKAATMTNSVNGFRKAGLFPCNRHIFTDEEFSIFNDGDEEQDLLNVQRNDENADLEDTSCVLTSIENQSEPTEILPNSGITNDNPSDEYQGLASSKTASTASVYDNPVPSTSSSVSPFALKPVPRLPKNNSSSKKTRTGAASIITASPYKKSLEES
ncbi:hypothetical protein HHI36_012980 [Cryptolaemus montrouzieri]|uniref:HTH psq-type domain-containing protein n=1 Tax=Cryptolaemus montrouzieri TaxID=559131 RepID=A0ABD2NGV8_9CUCU